MRSEPFQKLCRAFSFKMTCLAFLSTGNRRTVHGLLHHDVHRIVADLLRDGNQLDAVLRQFADVQLTLEMMAEETAGRVNDYHGERPGCTARNESQTASGSLVAPASIFTGQMIPSDPDLL